MIKEEFVNSIMANVPIGVLPGVTFLCEEN